MISNLLGYTQEAIHVLGELFNITRGNVSDSYKHFIILLGYFNVIRVINSLLSPCISKIESLITLIQYAR